MQPLPYLLKHRVSVLALISILAFGGLVRVWDLPTQSYWMDEGFTVNAVRTIQETNGETLSSGFEYSCPLYCYPSAWIADTFGDSPTSYRILAAIAGTIVIAVIYIVARRLFTPTIALLATLFTSVSYFQIAWSRQARWYTLFELFFWLSVLFFYQSLYGKRWRVLSGALTVLFAALAALTHDLGYLLPLIFIGWLAIDAMRRKAVLVKTFAFIAAAGAALLGGAIVYLGLEPTFVLPFYLNFYLRSYWLFILLSVLALIHPANHFKKETALLGLIAVAYIVPLSFLSDIINYRYLFHLTPVLFMLAAIGITAIQSDIKNVWAKWSVIPIVLVVLLMSGQGVFFPGTNYFLEADNPESVLLKNRSTFIFVPQPEWNEAYRFVKENRMPEDTIVTTQSTFNEIFLDEPGYWIRYSYNGKDYMQETADDREFYVGAKIIRDAEQLRALAASTDGYVLFDVYAERRMPDDIQEVIRNEMTEVFHRETNAYSEVWVYRF